MSSILRRVKNNDNYYCTDREDWTMTMREREERLTVPHELSDRQIKNKPTNGTKINIKKGNRATYNTIKRLQLHSFYLFQNCLLFNTGVSN
jgi:hypothetical protein